MSRYTSSFLLTTTIYIFGFGVFTYFYENTQPENVEHSEQRTKLRICMSQLQTADLKPQPQKQKKLKQQKPTKKLATKKQYKTTEQKKVANSQLKQKFTSQTEYEQVQSKIQEEVIIEERAIQKAKEAQKEEELRLAKKTKQEAAAKAYEYKCKQEALKKSFTETLISKINANKSYPSTARRRAIEGDVKVRFEILADGSVDNIEITSGKSIFEKATREAIERSFPLEVQNTPYSFPETFSLTITYKLLRS
ncbi:MAG: energy transducer TonB [Campylobacterales bacterium]|nr:energy transducer TonB [Campylobacterales bacterium]